MNLTFFRSSFRELKSLRSLLIAAMLLAIHTVLSVFISIQVTESLRISISFIANVIAACLFGPVVGFLNGALGDLLQFLLKPSGGYFFGWTLNAALAGLIYGIAFYRKLPQIKSPTASKASKEQMDWDRTNRNQTNRFLKFITPLFSVFILLCWLFAPFLAISEKLSEKGQTPAILSDGTALQTVLHTIQQPSSSNKSALMLAILILLLSILILLLSLRKNKALSLLFSILTAFLLLLSWYTDRKTMTPHWGFWLITLLFLATGLSQLLLMAHQHRIDIRYLLRVLLTVTVVCLGVNALLGTYWCTIMYGKHFMVYFVSRFVKNLIQIPINTALIYYLLQALADVPEFRRLLSHNHSDTP